MKHASEVIAATGLRDFLTGETMNPTVEPAGDAAREITPLPELPQARMRGLVELTRILADHPEHAGYIKQLVDAETQRDTFDQDWRTARVFAVSGKFDDIKGSTPEQAIATAMAKIRIGREWGMSDSDSIAFIYWVNGRPAVMTEILATKIQEAGYNWDVEWHWTALPQAPNKARADKRCVGCTLWLKALNRQTGRYEPVLDRNNEPVSASFTEYNAEQAGLLTKSGPWKNWTEDMYFWRAMSRLRKYYLTGVMRGAIQVELANDYSVTVAPELAAPEEAQVLEDPIEDAARILRERVMKADPFPQGEQMPLAPEEPTK